MKIIYLIRHAETEMNAAANVVAGRSPHTILTEKGLMQAKRLGEYLSNNNINFDEIYSSDTIRTRHTARIAGDMNGFTEEDLIIRDELQEIHQGDWEGISREIIYTPETIKNIQADNWNFKAPNGESQKDVEYRVMGLIKELISDVNKSDNICLFTHGFTIRCFLRHILDSDARMSFRLHIDNTSITKVGYDGENWHIYKINGTEHLG